MQKPPIFSTLRSLFNLTLVLGLTLSVCPAQLNKELGTENDFLKMVAGEITKK